LRARDALEIGLGRAHDCELYVGDELGVGVTIGACLRQRHPVRLIVCAVDYGVNVAVAAGAARRDHVAVGPGLGVAAFAIAVHLVLVADGASVERDVLQLVLVGEVGHIRVAERAFQLGMRGRAGAVVRTRRLVVAVVGMTDPAVLVRRFRASAEAENRRRDQCECDQPTAAPEWQTHP